MKHNGWPAIVARLERRIDNLERRLAGVLTKGTVAEIDEEKKLIRVKTGKAPDGSDQLSPWVQYAQMAGALKVHAMPSVGQNMVLISAGGDYGQGFAVPLSWNDNNQSPGKDASENVITFGDATARMTGSMIELVVGGVKWQLTSDGEKTLGGEVRHNDRNIGDSHIHGGVEPGGANTDVPSN